jgi:hypothetical protein
MYSSILITTNEIVIAVVGYVMVFLSLLLLYAFFHNLPKLLYINLKRVKKGKQVEVPDEFIASGEEIAAIATALYLFFDEMHDEESGKLTIKKVSKVYSPWSSKIYAVRNQFNRI